MCGIAGIFSTGRLAEGALDLLKRMTRTLSHRGPDGEGYYLDEHAGLGHRRLSIIDLDAGKQPMCNEDESASTCAKISLPKVISLEPSPTLK